MILSGAAFHAPTWLYTYVHTAASKVPVASEVHGSSLGALDRLLARRARNA